MEQGRTLVGASPAQAAGPRAVLRMPLQLRSQCTRALLFQPLPPPPAPPWEPDALRRLLHLRREQTRELQCVG